MTVLAATPLDLDILCALDPHLDRKTQEQKIARNEVIVCWDGDEIVGVVRYSLFWDKIPFINWLWVKEENRVQGIGRALMASIVREARRLDQNLILTSTQSDEPGQHFYRKIGFRDIGGFVLGDEPLEIILSLKVADA